jgi:hypothetical protein
MKSEQEGIPMSEQQSEPTITTATATETTPSDAWGQPIGEKRQAELQEYVDRWHASYLPGALLVVGRTAEQRLEGAF